VILWEDPSGLMGQKNNALICGDTENVDDT
jgi:hypothetical protein